jgi:hypothetical protein
MVDSMDSLGTTAGDVAQVLQFFAALYFGTPLIGTYGEASLNALQRRWTNCSDALGEEEAAQHARLGLAQDSLDNLRLAIDRPFTKGGARVLLALGGLHLGLSMVLETVASQPIAAVGAFWLFAIVACVYVLFGARGIAVVLVREAEAVAAVKAVEQDVRKPARRG